VQIEKRIHSLTSSPSHLFPPPIYLSYLYGIDRGKIESICQVLYSLSSVFVIYPHLSSRFMITTSSVAKIPASLEPNQMPHHVAMIMDGNGRWAQQRGLPRIAGHQQGANRVKELLRCCKDWGIQSMTIYAFSTENWGRPTAEVEFLMRLFEGLLKAELAEMHAEGVRIRFLGDRAQVPPSLQQMMQHAIDLTAHNQDVLFNVAINYGSRKEIANACQNIAKQVQLGEVAIEDINEALFNQYLDTAGLPDPDLLIRTSGEQRLSNFLLWQLAYTEIYVTQTCWPDFNRDAFTLAVANYQQRQRRFGKI
jgi:undecaprenyl diphosphate synthase